MTRAKKGAPPAAPPKKPAKPSPEKVAKKAKRPAAGARRAPKRPAPPPEVARVSSYAQEDPTIDAPESLEVEMPPVSARTTPQTVPPEAPPPSAIADAEATASVADVGAAIRELEAHLDSLIKQPATSEPEPPPSAPESAPGRDAEGTVFDSARELLSTDYYLRRWGRLGMRNRSEEVDDFGFDPVYAEKVRPLLDFLYTTYFRVEAAGLENVPSEGRCLLVANHSGTVPLDGAMIGRAIKREHPSPRDVRWLNEDFIYHFPFLGSIGTRLGAVRACQENAERLLAHEELVCVFPEGIKGIGKLFRDRYRLQRFGRGGFVKLCLRTSTPIVPVAVVGAEETSPLLFRHEYLARAFGVPYVPITPTFPLLGPMGLIPAPTKWKIVFGEKIVLEQGPEDAEDEVVVGRLTERVRATIQAMLDRELGARRSVFFG
ncbi:MAG: acyltransferase family protein [Myxococcales bacterium]|nr:acyltransferase family protein [Myxococcales bacterium]